MSVLVIPQERDFIFEYLNYCKTKYFNISFASLNYCEYLNILFALNKYTDLLLFNFSKKVQNRYFYNLVLVFCNFLRKVLQNRYYV